MQVIFSADLVEDVGLALPDASHAYFLLEKLGLHMQGISSVAPESSQSSEQDCVLSFPLAHLLNCFEGILH